MKSCERHRFMFKALLLFAVGNKTSTCVINCDAAYHMMHSEMQQDVYLVNFLVNLCVKLYC